MEAAQFRELLDIAIVPSMKLEYYKALRARYNDLIYQNSAGLPPKPPAMYLDSGSPEGRKVIMGAFRAMKRGLGYGR